WPGRIVAPEIQTTDEHSVVEEIDHRAGAEGGDQLAQADLALGRLLAGALGFAHRLFPSKGPSLGRSQRCVVSSTSRMEVGARKRPSGVIGSGAFGSRAVCSRGGPPVFSRSKGE